MNIKIKWDKNSQNLENSYGLLLLTHFFFLLLLDRACAVTNKVVQNVNVIDAMYQWRFLKCDSKKAFMRIVVIQKH